MTDLVTDLVTIMSLKNQSVAVEMAVEARAMASYALSNGIAVPGWVLETLARVDDGIETPEAGGGDAGRRWR